MNYKGLKSFLTRLEKEGELKRISQYVNPSLEITEITDRVTKSGGPALLFENNGTKFPLLINAFGSEKRMALALGRQNLDEAAKAVENTFATISSSQNSLFSKIARLPVFIKLAGIMPSKSGRRGKCQEVIHTDPDLSILPVLKCWPFDGGKFITLPVVNTFHPVTGKTNAGMYRMQLLDKNTTAMHWQLHKTGAAHFEAWKSAGRKMPVSVVLGGDPVYTYVATAPLPENVDEYILAGYMRGKRVKLVKSITNKIYVPEDADIVIEGYVDPSEDPVWEGPFGDHTGFYSLADWYPRFHVTCITHSRNAVYPATIVGIPPQEDAFLAMATEKIFLAPIKLALQPEVEDLHMPDPGVAHNLVMVRIRKTYPGQGMKVINSLFGAGQMMFTKYLLVVSGDINIRNYDEVLNSLLKNTDFGRDILFFSGPLDVLDHSSDRFASGGKAGIDATVKTSLERTDETGSESVESRDEAEQSLIVMKNQGLIQDFRLISPLQNRYIAIISAVISAEKDTAGEIAGSLAKKGIRSLKLAILVDHAVDIDDNMMVAWQLLGNSDPRRDHYYIAGDSVLLDGTIKEGRHKPFPRSWPNAVCSSGETISWIDELWTGLGFEKFIPSPSLKYKRLLRPGNEEILKNPRNTV